MSLEDYYKNYFTYECDVPEFMKDITCPVCGV